MIGLFGGTFDPFHEAHRALAEHAIKELALDRLTVMPAGRPPHKSRRISFSAFRFEMTRLGLEGIESVDLSDLEIREDRLSYTYDTVLRLKEQYPGEKIILITGSDTLFQIDSWYRPLDLLQEAELAVALRGREDRERALTRARHVEETLKGKVTLFPMPRMEVSSSMIRDRLEQKESIKGLCPKKVENFIEACRFYDFHAELEAFSDEDWLQLLDAERFAWPYYSQPRRLHAASVALYAARLARILGADAREAALLGLLHDVAKELPLEEQRALASRYLPGDEGACQLSASAALCHGPASAGLALEAGIIGRESMKVIAFHSTAAPGMDRLGEILFLADKISYDRDFPRLDRIRDLAESGKVKEAVVLCLEEVFMALEESGEAAHPISQEAYRHYLDRL